ncbi:hypothetical protein GCM10009850_089300 [Nonomuraea monospora]|uniref:Transposase n=1 Tax=Nonomuraea monospora TaxID=568818 RepID=A0ABP5PP46_9ACTN
MLTMMITNAITKTAAKIVENVTESSPRESPGTAYTLTLDTALPLKGLLLFLLARQRP